MEIKTLTMPKDCEFSINGFRVDSAGRLHINDLISMPKVERDSDGQVLSLKVLRATMDITLKLTTKDARLLAYEILAVTEGK